MLQINSSWILTRDGILFYSFSCCIPTLKKCNIQKGCVTCHTRLDVIVDKKGLEVVEDARFEISSGSQHKPQCQNSINQQHNERMQGCLADISNSRWEVFQVSWGGVRWEHIGSSFKYDDRTKGGLH